MDWIVLALALCALERGSWAFIAAAGIAAGLAIACLQPGVFVLPPLCLALWMMPRSRGVRIACVALVPIAAAAFASLFYARLPYVDAEGLHLAGEGSHVIARENVTGSGFLQCVALLRAHDPALAILAGVGLLVAIGLLATRTSEVTAGGRRALWIVAAYALPYAAVISIDSEVYERFLLPLVPCIACLAAAAVMWIARRAAALASALARRAGARATPSNAARLDGALRASAFAIVIVAAIAQPGYADLRYVLAATAPDTYQQTAAWLEREPGAHSARILVSSSLVLPVFWSERALRAHAAAERKASLPWLVYQSFVPADERHPSFDMYAFPVDLMLREEADLPALKRYVDELAPDYVILEDIPRANNWPMLRLLRKWAVVEGSVVFETHGESPDVETLGPLDFQDVVELAARIVDTRAFGPKIAIFRIRH
jgi:4-amino-4-deoxy-L-arabinose transferase-like glycosyltransferase